MIRRFHPRNIGTMIVMTEHPTGRWVEFDVADGLNTTARALGFEARCWNVMRAMAREERIAHEIIAEVIARVIAEPFDSENDPDTTPENNGAT